MTLKTLSPKQKLLLKWAFMPSTKNKYKAVVCDGAVRSGKTVCMSIAFILWAMANFDGDLFGICGKTLNSVERNILHPIENSDDILCFYDIKFNKSQNMLTVKGQGKENKFYFFGGKDESSYSLIQGITLSGVMFDEVALMPQSFVEQAIARTLSVENTKLWFNCNPENPNHYFYKQWIEKSDEKNALHIHFLMEDNPILSRKIIDEAKKLYEGVFYKRYILGQWVAPQGLIYTMFEKERHVVASGGRVYEKYIISCDYGTVNPTSMGLWGLSGSKWYRVKESYFDSRACGKQKTDLEHYRSLVELASRVNVEKVIVDPSAASFIECIRREGVFTVQRASNKVLDGIREVANHLNCGDILFCDCCKDSIKEFGLYSWDTKSTEDKPIKENDHAMDEIRYFVKYAFGGSLMGFE
ncbi:MAG: PBSX family phage terminase large subunit [Clostridia bacterium]